MDPYDKRSRIIRLTPAGVRLESVILQAARDAESRLERQLGRDRFRSLRASLVEASGLLQTEQKPSAETGG
jgi:DNA-binding MarR family transcriptional regulator